MALFAGDVIEAARFRHAQFVRAVIPTSVAANMVNEVVYQLLLATHQANPSYLTRLWTITMLPGQDRAAVGAGSATGAPLVQGTTTLRRTDTAAGALATEDDTASILASEGAVTGATATSLTDNLRSWTVDLYIGARARITEGLGAGQVREIASNTADTLQLTEAWEVEPDTTSMYVVEQDRFVVEGDFGAVQGDVPTERTTPAWLVKYDAQGQPYLDLANPIEVTTTDGIPLPPHYHVNHGRIYINPGQGVTERGTFTLIDPTAAVDPPRAYCGYVENEKLWLAGDTWKYRHVTRIEIPYLPLNVPVTAAGDVLVLPDAAREAVVSGVAALMLERARQMGVAGGATSSIDSRASIAQQLYLQHVGKQGRATVSRIREVW